MQRRDLLKAGAITAGALALPAKVFAQTSPLDAYQRNVLKVAARERDRNRKVLWRTDVVGVADFARPSSLPRFHFADLDNGRVTSYLVAHGKGSDPEGDGWLKTFSNEIGSIATSQGAFITWEWYTGKYGTSVRLGGLDPTNSNALPRAIVLHPAWYAEPAMLLKWGKLGRSDGCFAMAQPDFMLALQRLSGGRLIYADKLAQV